MHHIIISIVTHASSGRKLLMLSTLSLLLTHHICPFFCGQERDICILVLITFNNSYVYQKGKVDGAVDCRVLNSHTNRDVSYILHDPLHWNFQCQISNCFRRRNEEPIVIKGLILLSSYMTRHIGRFCEW